MLRSGIDITPLYSPMSIYAAVKIYYHNICPSKKEVNEYNWWLTSDLFIYLLIFFSPLSFLLFFIRINSAGAFSSLLLFFYSDEV